MNEEQVNCVNDIIGRMILSVVEFRDDAFEVRVDRRGDGQIRITLYDDGEPYMVATKFVEPELWDAVNQGRDLAFIKDYSENEGILDALIEFDLVRDAGVNGERVTIPAGYAELVVVFVNPMLL